MKVTKFKGSNRGSAIIFVIILLVPVMFAAAVLMGMVSTDFTVSSSNIKGKQALYNAEAGIEWGIKKLQLQNYDKTDMSIYNKNIVYIMDGGSSFSESNNCFKSFVEYLPASKSFTIDSTGKFGGITRTLTKEVNREGLLTLSRKFSCESLTVSEGKVYFQTTPFVMGDRNQDKFLITDTEGLRNNPNVYTYIYGGGIDSSVKVDAGSFFIIDGDSHNTLPEIKSPSTMRKQWIPYTTELQYYVSEKNAEIIIGKDSLLSPMDSFFQGFTDFSGDYDLGVFNSNLVRVMLIDGNLVLRGIRGDFEEGKLTFSERFFSNLVIYCTGKVTIEDCDFRGYAGGTVVDKDLNFSIHSREIDFMSVTDKTIISSLSGNASLIKSGQEKIIEVIKRYTTPYSNWSLGF